MPHAFGTDSPRSGQLLTLNSAIFGMAGKLRSRVANQTQPPEYMLEWTLIFLVIALIAAALGFTGIAGKAAGIAKILFVIFLIVWIVTLIL